MRTSPRASCRRQRWSWPSALADEWGLHGDAWVTPSAMDLLRAPGAPVTMADALRQEMGYELTAAERPAYPGVSELRARMGL